MTYRNPEIYNPVNNLSIPEYASNPTELTTRQFDLSVARNKVLVHIGPFNFLWAYKSNSITGELDIHLEEQQNDSLTVKEGMQLGGIAAKKIYLTNTAQSGKTIDILFINQVRGNVTIKNSASALSQISFTTPSTIQTVSDVSVLTGVTKTLVNADTDRKELVIRNLSNSVDIRIGDNANVGAGRGHLLKANEAVILTTTSEMSAYQASGGTTTVSVLEVLS